MRIQDMKLRIPVSIRGVTAVLKDNPFGDMINLVELGVILSLEDDRGGVAPHLWVYGRYHTRLRTEHR